MTSALHRIAGDLDRASLYECADRVDRVWHRVAQFGYMTNHFNVPIQDRVIPWKETGTEAEDADSDFWKHPRHRPSDMEETGDNPADKGINESATTKVDAPKSKLDALRAVLHDLGGTMRELTPKDEEPATPFNMDDRDPSKGGSEFDINADGAVGFQYVHHDSQSAGMVGLDKFEEKAQMMQNLQSPYSKLLPQR